MREAFEREMSHYAAHAQEARDADSLAALREDCAAILSDGLGREVGVEAMMAAISFEAYADAPGTLAELRARGLPIVCVSNWDFELELVLERVGLRRYLRGAVTSALAGARKPDPAIFETRARAGRVRRRRGAARRRLRRGRRGRSRRRDRGPANRPSRRDGRSALPRRAAAAADRRACPPVSETSPAPSRRLLGPPPLTQPQPPPKRRNALDAYIGLPETGWSGWLVVVGVLTAFVLVAIGTVTVAIFDPGWIRRRGATRPSSLSGSRSGAPR